MRALPFVKLIIFFLLFTIFISTISCSLRSEGVSIDEQLSQVDALIAVGDYDGAWSALKNVAKTIRNPSETLGVVRRALLLQRGDFAKEQLFEALKEAPENPELIAVYSHILISEKDYEEALPYARLLEGGNYGSLYSELRFLMDEENIKKINREKKEGEEAEKIDYYSESYVQAYVDIARSTDAHEYLRNAALIYALQGSMAKAFSYHPPTISAYESPWFWAQISYDNHKFDQVISDLQHYDLNIDELSLLADAYVHLGFFEDAQRTWLESTQRFTNENPIAWHNTALYYQEIGNTKQAHDLVLHLVETFPDYVGGLAVYGRFSLLDDEVARDSHFSALLEERGLQTIQMEENATIVDLDIHDAMQRIDEAIELLKFEDESAAMELMIEKLKLDWSSSTTPPTAQQKVSDIWRLLEQNIIEPYGYNDVLVQYAMWFFFTQGMIDEAEGLFTSHITSRYASAFENSELGAKNPVENMDSWEYEYGSYIALMQGRYMDAEKWLTSLIVHNIVSPTIPSSTVINLATLYNATGKRSLALSLYEQIVLIIRDVSTKADIYYRMALIQYEMGEKQKASISLDEALRLDFNHSAARLLQKRMVE